MEKKELVEKKESTTKKVTFKVSAPEAGVVFLAGDFNNWDSAKKPLKKNEKGEWTVTAVLKPGKYQYKYVIDSAWQIDPKAETVTDNTGNVNNVKEVK
ncbi:MAG: hypothetical protein A2X42_07610 [Candidatus Margulisbacteria bacterium GWF2_38_17]|nr:MAG: hypothetical protein A2X43_09920 [Candidatus Margulisbacteria bacterium GWD2_39_127]OGI04662.1 MAG: hypothetical protein A2X42_07610 [Candidatus Margulisbacteria bacterium GWF2_38_17]OGI11920.1 MAG: hypothetical protein A2X41_11655 [Candidatus Margulisbacteria bacterium GWE2_39_32]